MAAAKGVADDEPGSKGDEPLRGQVAASKDETQENVEVGP
jgi:hypothetical protein